MTVELLAGTAPLLRTLAAGSNIAEPDTNPKGEG
jgi:hypothetical protein